MVTIPLAAEDALNVHVEVRTVALRDVGEQVAVIPDGEDVVRATVPVNPPNSVNVNVDVVVLPTVKDTDAGLGLRPKFGIGVDTPKNSLIGVLPQSLTRHASPQLSRIVAVRLYML